MSLLKEIKKIEKEMDAQGFTPEQKLQYKLWQEAIRKENNIVGEQVVKPNIFNPSHLKVLKDMMRRTGKTAAEANQAMVNIERKGRVIERKVDDEEMIKYKQDGENKEMKAGSAKTMEKDHPAKIEYDKLKDDKSGEIKKGNNPMFNDPETGEPDDNLKQTGGLNDEPTDEKEKQQKPQGTPIKKPLSSKTVSKHKDYINKAKEIAEKEENKDIKEAMNILNNTWEKFTNAQTEEEKLEAVETLIDNGLIERNQWSEKTAGKIYITSNAPGIPYKHFMGGGQGDALTNDMNRIIRENGLEVNMRNNSADRALADLSGKHNEAGVVALLDPSEENQKEYSKLRKKYNELGNDDSTAHEQNEGAAKLIKESLPEGSKIKSSIQVGGIGGSELMNKYGIDEKVDPTDMLVVYDDENGNEKKMKISAKIYTNPNDITMKNSGTKSAGRDYLGEQIGAPIDAKLQDMRDRHNYQEDGISDEEQKNRKRAFREEYLNEFGNGMKQLASTLDGEKKLVQMWKDVHGCGHDVHTLIVNKKTGESQLKDPDHYCNPKPPFEVKYDGTKVVINLESQTDEFIQIDCKTEMKSSPKLLFKHKVKKSK